MTPTMLFVLCCLLGGVSGLRTMTGIAMVTIAAHLHWLHLGGTALGFLARPVSMYIFVALAIGELISDKLPVPSRTQPGPLAARAVFGGFSASALAVAAGANWIVPALLGAISAVAGAYAGYWLRRTITAKRPDTGEGKGIPDLPVALLEDAVAIGLAWFVVSRFGA
jgi:uncharacterized membrane protein